MCMCVFMNVNTYASTHTVSNQPIVIHPKILKPFSPSPTPFCGMTVKLYL